MKNNINQSVRRQGERPINNPMYASMKVSLVAVRCRAGFLIGIGLTGDIAANKTITLSNANKELSKIKNRYGGLITKKIPKLDWDTVIEKSLIDDFDYDKNPTSRRSSSRAFEPKKAAIVAPVIHESVVSVKKRIKKNNSTD